MPITAASVKRELKAVAKPEKAAFYPSFFKAGPGEYGEGDRFLGVVVPDQRKIARKYRELSRPELDKLLSDPFHECRLTGLFILVHQFERTTDSRSQKEVVDYYLSKSSSVNNWDLVDASSHKILGAWLCKQTNRKILYRLGRSKCLWEQRIAMVATYALIKNGEFDETLVLAEQMLDHPHDLIHKATGWMLREVGKQNPAILDTFLNQHAASMPRTMLRYSIEKLSPSKRKHFMDL